LLNQCHVELRQFWRRKGVKHSISMVFLKCVYIYTHTHTHTRNNNDGYYVAVYRTQVYCEVYLTHVSNKHFTFSITAKVQNWSRLRHVTTVTTDQPFIKSKMMNCIMYPFISEHFVKKCMHLWNYSNIITDKPWKNNVRDFSFLSLHFHSLLSTWLRCCRCSLNSYFSPRYSKSRFMQG